MLIVKTVLKCVIVGIVLLIYGMLGRYAIYRMINYDTLDDATILWIIITLIILIVLFFSGVVFAWS